MNTKKCCCFAALGLLLTTVVCRGQEVADFQSQFLFQGKQCQVAVERSAGRADVVLDWSGERTLLSLGMTGENIVPRAFICGQGGAIVWINHWQGRDALAFFDMTSGHAELLRFPNIRSISAPAVIFAGERLQGLVFLGLAQDNDDIFYYDIPAAALLAVTRTAHSEKEIVTTFVTGGVLLHTKTLWDNAAYRVDFSPLRSYLLWRQARMVSTGEIWKRQVADEAANTVVSFGDSITYGEMHMHGLAGEYHPELAYPTVVRELLVNDYGQSYSINLGVAGDNTLGGAERVDGDLANVDARFFLLLLGTNDTWPKSFSLASALENLAYIVDAALDKKLEVIIATIPPRKDRFADYEYVWENIRNLNQGIIDLANSKQIGCVDTYTTFMDFNPPDGWKTLLEDDGGNHPSPAGHRKMAELFVPVIIAFPPRPPQAFTSTWLSGNRLEVTWPANDESDFDHYHIEYGFHPNILKWVIETARNTLLFEDPPLGLPFYFRIQALDKFDNRSSFSPLFRLQ